MRQAAFKPIFSTFVKSHLLSFLIHSFLWTTISECICVLDRSECTISFLMRHLYIFFNTSTLHNVYIIMDMWTLSTKCTCVHYISKCTLVLKMFSTFVQAHL